MKLIRGMINSHSKRNAYRRVGSQTKVDKFDLMFVVKENIFWFQIAMSKASIVNEHQDTKKIFHDEANFAFCETFL